MTDKNPLKGTEHLFSFLLFFIFLLCTAFTILFGSRVYENIHSRNDTAFQTTTALAYMTNKVRQNDTADSVSIRTDGSVQLLVLSSFLEDVEFETWIYQMDGELYELFTAAGSGLDLTAGQKIMDCEPVSFSLDENKNGQLLTISLKDSGRYADILLRSGAEGGEM